MNIDQAKQNIQSGSMVFWSDPDGGICSRTMKVRTVSFTSESVTIVEHDGSVVQCPLDELSVVSQIVGV